MPDFYSRMHPPTTGTTLGIGAVLIASILVSSAALQRPVIHELLMALLSGDDDTSHRDSAHAGGETTDQVSLRWLAALCRKPPVAAPITRHGYYCW